MNDSWSGRGIADFGADEVREVWDGEVQPVPADLLSPAVSPVTRQFLTEVGLPTAEEYGIVFAHDARLSRTVRQHGRDLLPITDTEVSGLDYVIDVRSDEVFQIISDLPDYLGFFNSNIAATVFFLGLLRKNVFSLNGTDASQDDVEDAIEAVRAVMVARDPAAMADRDTGWHSMLDEGYVT